MSVAVRIVVLWIALVATAQAGELAPWTGGATPELQARNLAGDIVKLDDFRGRTVIVNFWATWCAPCVAEMPALQRLRDRLARGGRRGDRRQLPGERRADRAVRRADGLTFPVVRDHDGSVRARPGTSTCFPRRSSSDRTRRSRWCAIGEIDWDDPRVESAFAALRLTA